MNAQQQGTGTWLVAAIGQHAHTSQPLFWHAPVAGWSADLHPLVYNEDTLQDVVIDFDGMPFLLYEFTSEHTLAEVRGHAQNALRHAMNRGDK